MSNAAYEQMTGNDHPPKRIRLEPSMQGPAVSGNDATSGAEKVTTKSSLPQEDLKISGHPTPKTTVSNGSHDSATETIGNEQGSSRTLDCHVRPPKHACCGLLFDVMQKPTTKAKTILMGLRMSTWSQSTKRPILRVFCCRGSFVDTFDDEFKWTEIARPVQLSSYPQLTKIDFITHVSVAAGQTVGLFLHTDDNWGVPYVVSDDSIVTTIPNDEARSTEEKIVSNTEREVSGLGDFNVDSKSTCSDDKIGDRQRGMHKRIAASVESNRLTIGFARVSTSNQPFGDQYLMETNQACHFSGSLEYKIASNMPSENAMHAKHLTVEAFKAANAACGSNKHAVAAAAAAAAAVAASTVFVSVTSTHDSDAKKEIREEGDRVKRSTHHEDGKLLPAKRFSDPKLSKDDEALTTHDIRPKRNR